MKALKNRAFDLKAQYIFLAGAILGAIVFLLIYGISIVNPTNDAWLLNQNSDMTQHYLGWKFFRRSQWHFPLGLMDGVLVDDMVSCMFTDSIPMFAIFFKILSPILPATFQYAGIWCLFCYIAQSGISALILRKFNKNLFFCLIGSTFFMLSPPMLYRMFMHESLGGHWIILLAILLWVYQNHKWKHKCTPIVLWAFAGIIAVNVHVYFLPMIYMILIGYIITDIAKNKKILRPILCFVWTTLSSLLAMYCIGAFYGDGKMDDVGLGVFSANLNTFFNGMGISKFVIPMNITIGQYEGFGYLGFGMLLAAFLAVIVIFKKAEKTGNGFFGGFKDIISAHRWEIIAFCAIVFISFFIAASPICSLNARTIYSIDYPEFIKKLLSVFRASGRFIWVADYLLYTAILAAISKLDGKKTILFTVSLCAILQYIDLRNYIKEKHETYSKPAAYVSALPDSVWSDIAKDGEQIVFMSLPSDGAGIMRMYFVFAEYALENDMTLNTFHIARVDTTKRDEYVAQQYNLLSQGKGNPNYIYVFADKTRIPDNDNLTVYTADGYTAVKVLS